MQVYVFLSFSLCLVLPSSHTLTRRAAIISHKGGGSVLLYGPGSLGLRLGSHHLSPYRGESKGLRTHSVSLPRVSSKCMSCIAPLRCVVPLFHISVAGRRRRRRRRHRKNSCTQFALSLSLFSISSSLPLSLPLLSTMAFTIGGLLEAVLLVVNAMAILQDYSPPLTGKPPPDDKKGVRRFLALRECVCGTAWQKRRG